MQKDGIENSRNGSEAAPKPSGYGQYQMLSVCHVCRNQTFTTLSDVHTSMNSFVGPAGGRAGKPRTLDLACCSRRTRHFTSEWHNIVPDVRILTNEKILEIETPTGKKLVRCSHVFARKTYVSDEWYVPYYVHLDAPM
jgi:hypothetical protein